MLYTYKVFIPLSTVDSRSGQGNHSDVVSRMHSSFFMVVYSSIALSGGSVRILGPLELATAHLAVLLLRQELGHLRVEGGELVLARGRHHAGAGLGLVGPSARAAAERRL